MGRFAPSRIGGFSTLTVLAVISIYPFVWMVLTSLRDRNTVFTGPLASIAARILRGRLQKTFEATTAHCGRLAERRSSH